eukprot:6465939-Amphidinium_carterae.2
MAAVVCTHHPKTGLIPLSNTMEPKSDLSLRALQLGLDCNRCHYELRYQGSERAATNGVEALLQAPENATGLREVGGASVSKLRPVKAKTQVKVHLVLLVVGQSTSRQSLAPLRLWSVSTCQTEAAFLREMAEVSRAVLCSQQSLNIGGVVSRSPPTSWQPTAHGDQGKLFSGA